MSCLWPWRCHPFPRLLGGQDTPRFSKTSYFKPGKVRRKALLTEWLPSSVTITCNFASDWYFPNKTLPVYEATSPRNLTWVCKINNNLKFRNKEKGQQTANISMPSPNPFLLFCFVFSSGRYCWNWHNPQPRTDFEILLIEVNGYLDFYC